METELFFTGEKDFSEKAFTLVIGGVKIESEFGDICKICSRKMEMVLVSSWQRDAKIQITLDGCVAKFEIIGSYTTVKFEVPILVASFKEKFLELSYAFHLEERRKDEEYSEEF